MRWWHVIAAEPFLTAFRLAMMPQFRAAIEDVFKTLLLLQIFKILTYDVDIAGWWSCRRLFWYFRAPAAPSWPLAVYRSISPPSFIGYLSCFYLRHLSSAFSSLSFHFSRCHYFLVFFTCDEQSQQRLFIIARRFSSISLQRHCPHVSRF